MQWRLSLVGLAATAFLAACGGGDSFTQGALIKAPTASASLTPDALAAAASQVVAVTGPATCTINFHHYEYTTLGGAGEHTTSSGAVITPSGTSASCSGSRPVLLYAHGTSTDKNFNMASPTNPEAVLVAATYAAQGYIVVAPNYAGYHTSSLGYHPYLNMNQQAGEMVDAWNAVKSSLPAGLQSNGKLFVAGYSQGGFVSMATQRALQMAGTPVTAGAHLSGVYALGRFGDAVYAGNVNAGATVFSPLLTTSFQRAYGNIYTTPGDMYESAYATGIESLLPSNTAVETLIGQGKLPQLQMFKGDPPEPRFAIFFGDQNLVKTSYRNAVIADAVTNPTTPQHPLRMAGYRNDLLNQNWTPTQPMFLCGGGNDPTVFFDLNTNGAKTYFNSKGVPDSSVVVLDVDSAAGNNDPFAAAKTGFATAFQQKVASSSLTDAMKDYHGILVPPFCNAAARGYFSSF